MGLIGLTTSKISAAVAGICQFRCAANTRLRIAYAANVQGAILAVLSINAAFGAGTAGTAGFAVCFVQIAAMGQTALGQFSPWAPPVLLQLGQTSSLRHSSHTKVQGLASTAATKPQSSAGQTWEQFSFTVMQPLSFAQAWSQLQLSATAS